jgi:hypothetical protein
MKLSITSLSALLLIASLPAFSQTAKSTVVEMTTVVNVATPSVTLNWQNPNPAYFVLFRREKDAADWFILLEAINSTTSTFTDSQVTVGQTYEYGIQRQVGNISSYGFALVPIEAPVVDDRGDISVFVEEALTSPLSAELERLRKDLVGDGWDVQWHVVPTTATVASVKSQVVADYTANGTDAVLLFGDLPIPYSGNAAWDGHDEHQGAWPSDAYYGDVDSGFWTDSDVNTITNPIQPARPQTTNTPGDGKFDQDYIPTSSEMTVGRVDFSNLSTTTFGISTLDMYRRYLEKNHKWRSKLYTVDNKVLVDDNFGYFSGEAFASDGYRNGNPLVGPANVMDGDFFNDTDDNSYLFAYGCGPGTYTSAGGVGTSAQFGTDTVNVVFSQLFGSYHGDWDYSPDPFLVSALASKGGILTCSWAGRPHWYTHHLGGGETMAYSALQTLNACDNIGYSVPSIGDCGAYLALMGDPTVRAHNVSRVPSVSAAQLCDQVILNWQASTQGNVIGYHVYRSNQANGGFERLSQNLLTNLTFTDDELILGDVYYMVKAVVREATPSGIYFNTSTGTTTTLTIGSITLPTIGLPSSVVLNCITPTYQITSCGAGLSCVINGPGISGGIPPLSISQAGVYTVTVSDAVSGCTASATLTVTTDNVIPAGPTATVGAVNCQAQTVQLNGGSSTQGVIYSWTGPNGFTSNQQNPVVSAGGTYTLTTTISTNGCTSSTTVNVPSPQAPNATATGGGINCVATSVQLMGNSTTPNVSYAWVGPNGFTSNLQNPTVSTVGNYVLTVTSASGCTSTATAVVAVQNNVPQASPTVPGTLTCTVLQTTINANPNQAGYNFAWTGPNGFTSNAQNPSATLPGLYSLTMTDPISGCTATATAIVSQNINPPTGTDASLGTVNCLAQTVQLLGTATGTDNTYAWSGPNGFTSGLQNPSVTQSGDYTLTVLNTANGCTASASVNVPALVIPSASAAGGTLTCTSASVQLQGNVTPSNVNIVWNGPNGFTSTELTPTVNVVGNYVLTVTAPSGCTATATAIVNQSGDFPVASPTAIGILTCVNGQVTIMANPSQSGYTFSWSGPGGFTSTAQNPTVTAAGLYFVQVTNPMTGCIATYSAQVMEFELPDVDVLPDLIETTCNEPFITLDLTGICDQPGITCALNGQPVATQTTLNQPGVYVLLVTHAQSGCSASESFTILGNTGQPNLSIDGDLELDCAGDLTSLTALSTTPGVTFFWTGLDNNASQIVSSGSYTVVATTPNGCSASASANVTAPQPLMLSLNFVNGCDGTIGISVIASGGVGPYSTQVVPSGPLPSGAAFSVIVTDANGCVETISGTIPNAPAPMTATAMHTNETVLGLNNGTALAQATGGTLPYTYLWSNNATTASINNLAPGIYTCTIEDANGCQETVSVTILAGTSGTDELPGLRNLRLSPNPTSGQFELSIALDNPLSIQVELLDVMGRILTQTKREMVLERTWQFDLGFAPAGVYYCKIKVEGGTAVMRIVKVD